MRIRGFTLIELVKVIITLLIIAQLLISNYYIGSWFRDITKTYLIYINTPKEERIFTTSIDEYYAILTIRKEVPENANILWIKPVSEIVNYYIYPRKVYQYKKFKLGEEVKVPTEFLKAKNITHVFVDYGKLYALKELQ